MAKKKVESDFEKAVEAFTERNFNDGHVMTTQPYLGWLYRFPDGSEHTFTEEILEAVIATGRVKLVSRNEKLVSLMGIK